jgi:hypothetical protein
MRFFISRRDTEIDGLFLNVLPSEGNSDFSRYNYRRRLEIALHAEIADGWRFDNGDAI